MGIARRALLRASHSQWLATKVMRRSFARRAVKKFMPGEELGDALTAARSLASQRIGTLITRLGESLTGVGDADQVRDHYLGAFDRIKADRLPTWISVKPTQLALDHSFDACLAHLRVLAARAAATGNLLWIDMESSPYVDPTLELYRTLKQQYDPVGLAMQTYLYRTPKDIESLLPLKPIVRLVKGAYNEPPDVAFPNKSDTDAAFVSLGETLLAAAATGGALPVFGTHDMTIVDRLTKAAAARGVSDDKYELHMLYGIRSSEQRALANAGRTVKVLISYGSAWFPWYMRRLAERPANVWFVVKSMVG
jgi:proline dehydrogenase